MRIGIDLSVIQTPHRMRGIGSVAINFINHISDEARGLHKFVLFLYEEERDEALDILDLRGIDYEVRTLQKPSRVEFKLPGKFRKFNGIINSLKTLRDAKKGDNRGGDLSDLDTYLQFDQMQPVPKVRGLRTAVLLYDLIPYVMEADYLWSYKTARLQGDSRKSSLRKSLLRKQYLVQVTAVCKAADRLIAISEYTKQDFIKYTGTPAQKINVVHLGVSRKAKIASQSKVPEFDKYIANSWGYFPQPVNLAEKPFILFVGGADPRRRLIDLIAAFNNLRAMGQDIRLVFAGDTMKGPRAIPVPNVQKYLLDSPYLEDIIFLGFVSDAQREWLYGNTKAFIYPSVYEGFGLPVLEAMQYGTPVITYKNSSIYEIAGDAAIYANDFLNIKDTILELLADKSLVNRYKKLGQNQAKLYSWQSCTDKLFKVITD